MNGVKNQNVAPVTVRDRIPGFWGLVLVLGFLAYWALYVSLRPGTRGDEHWSLFQWPVDFQVYFEGATNLRFGRDLYAGNLIGGLPFTYPPFAGVVMQIFSFADFQAATILWQATTIVVLLAVIAATFRQRGYGWSPALLVLVVLTFLASLNLASIYGTFFWGQINILLMGLVALDFLRSRRARTLGVGTGLAAGLKLTPAFNGVLFLIERKWAAAVVSFGVFLLTVGIGFLFVPDAGDFWGGKMFETERIGQEKNPGALCLKALVIREGWPWETASWIFLIAVVLWIFYIGARGAVRANNYAMALGLSGTTATLLSPFSWFHHWVFSVPLAIALLDVLLRFFCGYAAKLPYPPLRWLGEQLGGLLAAFLVWMMFWPQVSGVSHESMMFFAQSESDNWFVRELFIYSSILIMAAVAIGYTVQNRLKKSQVG